MRKRSSRHGTKHGVAALVSFALLAAACGGGSDDDSGGDSGSSNTEATESTDAPAETDGGDTEVETDESDDGDEIVEDVIETEEEEAVQGGTLRYGIEADVDGLNPTTSGLSSPGLMMVGTVMDTLSAYDVDGNAVPYLAESIEAVDGDLSKWQVKVREGITFHDGTPLNAEALQINFETQLADPLVGLAVRPFVPETGATEIIDEYTIQYNQLEPNVGFPGTLSTQLGYVASPKWLAAALADPTLNQEPVGTGPFIFDSRSADSVTRMVRNDDWWGGEVFLDAIEFLPITNAADRNDQLFKGDIQGLHTDDQAAVLELLDDDNVQNITTASNESEFFMINSSVPPFDDIRARQALTLAAPIANYRTLIGLGVAPDANQMFNPDSPYYNPAVVQEGDMPDEAAALVAEYCADRGGETNPILEMPACTDGKINMEYQWSGPKVLATRVAELMEQGWSDSFNVTFDEVPQDENINQAAFGTYNVIDWRQFDAIDPANDRVWLMCRNIGGISLNWPKFCDEERDAQINEAQATLDPEVRAPLYQSIAQNLHDAYTYIFTVHTAWDTAFASEIRGVCDRTVPGTDIDLRCATRGYNRFDTTWIAG
jgi:peptide/nickel transport system substrate-binding protein